MNNKMIKGSIAGATGIVLLMGGFGTYALWNDSADLSGTISSGRLNLALGTPAWTDASSDIAGDPVWDVVNDQNGVDLMVPGDTVQLTQPFTVEAAGKNLLFDVTVNGLSSATWQELDVTMQLDGTTVEPAASIDQQFTVATNDDGSHELTVFFDFPKNSYDGVETDNTNLTATDQGEAVDVSDITISIDQVRPGV